MTLQEQMIALKTIMIKEILRFSRIWVQTILPPAITTALYFVIFGRLIGPQIGTMQGYAYMDYIVPGLIMMSVITNSYANVVSSFYGSKFQHNIEEMLVAPIPDYIILLGYVIGGVCRGITVGVAVTVVAWFFSDLKVEHTLVILSTVLLTAILFSLAGLINGIYARSFDDISIVPTFILTPLTYLGGIFYSIEMLSPFWQNASLFNPILYMVNTFRYGFLGITDIPLSISYSIIIGFIVILFWFSMYLLKKGHGLRT